MRTHDLILVLAVVVVAFDFQNVLSWSKRRVLELPFVSGCSDYTVVIPLYGNPVYFDGRARLLRYQKRVLVAIDTGDPRMGPFADQLEEEGWRVCRVRLERPGAPSIMLAVLEAGAVKTTYVVRLDADTLVIDDLDRAVEAMRRDGADLCSVKCHVYRPKTWCQRFQALEYEMAMLSRHYRPSLTSGACFIARTASLLEILRHHTMCFYGEDVETGRIAHGIHLRIRHVDLQVETDAPESWMALLRQRRSWWAGMFRGTIINFDRNALHRPMWTIYYVGLVYLGAFMRVTGYGPGWGEILHRMPLVFVIYVGITFVANWQVRSPLMVLFPIYALVQSTVLPIVGIAWYFRLWRVDGYPGRYRYPYLRRRFASHAA